MRPRHWLSQKVNKTLTSFLVHGSLSFQVSPVHQCANQPDELSHRLADAVDALPGSKDRILVHTAGGDQEHLASLLIANLLDIHGLSYRLEWLLSYTSILQDRGGMAEPFPAHELGRGGGPLQTV